MARRKKVDKLPLERRTRRFPLWAIGIITLGLIVGLFYVSTKRHAITVALTSGHTVKAQFNRQYLLLKDQTKVKVAGVPVGVVTGVKHDSQGALVSMKITGGNEAKLGTAPSASLRLVTLLGGISYVQLTPGGGPGSPHGTIPLSRTTTPVYIDSILSAVPPPAQQGAKRFVKQFETTFTNGGLKSTQKLLAHAPGALQPTAGVLTALQGDQPDDLTDLVSNLEATDATVTAKQGQIEQVVSGLGTFSATLGQESPALHQLAATLSLDLANTRSGLTALDTTLTEVDRTASVARPSVQRLGQLIDQSQPTLVEAAPVLNELQPFLGNLDPVLHQLVPTSTGLTTFLDQINGPVLDRVLNPIEPDLNKEQSVADEGFTAAHPATLYQAITYTATGLEGSTAYHDNFGHWAPVIAGENQYALVPSTMTDPDTDSCADAGGGGVGACPGNPRGDGNTSGIVAKKDVTPPGYGS